MTKSKDTVADHYDGSAESYHLQYERDLLADATRDYPANYFRMQLLINSFVKNNLKNVTIWGTGTPKREFLYVDEMARASIYLMNLDKNIYSEQTSSMCSHVNVGSGRDLAIKELAETIKEVVGFKGGINN